MVSSLSSELVYAIKTIPFTIRCTQSFGLISVIEIAF